MTHISILDDICLAFHPHGAVLLGLGHAAGLDQVVVGHDLGADEPTLDVGVNCAGRLDGGSS